jgi:diketogulonate reductase-like aldo/keto reductase
LESGPSPFLLQTTVWADNCGSTERMKRKAFGKTGRQIPEIGMGTYYDPLWIATAYLRWVRGGDERVDALKRGLELGMTLIDTAELYGSEPLVAKALEGRKRDEIFVATKVWSNHLHRDSLKAALEGSLRRLGLSYVDLYQIHFPNRRVPIGETMAGMEDLVQAGKVLHVGVSNFNIKQLQEANAALPKSQLASVQLSYSLRERSVEADILPYCNREGIALLAYFPLAHGRLPSDKRLAPLSARLGKTPSQVALRWLAMKENVFPIPRASNRVHVEENAGANGWELSGTDTSELASAFG